MSDLRWLKAASSIMLAGSLLLTASGPAAADSIRDQQWALSAFAAEDVWQESTGEGVTVAVIGSGADGSHPDLSGNVLPGKNVKNDQRADNVKTSNRSTAIAGLIAAHGHGPSGSMGIKGLAPDAKILPVRFAPDGLTLDPEQPLRNGPSHLANAITYAADEGASIILIPFDIGVLLPTEIKAITHALKLGSLVVSISGWGNNADPGYPASFPGVVSVGGVTKSGIIWDFSDDGPNTLLSAPAKDLESTYANGEYGEVPQTSGAAAYVAAAAALLQSKFPDLTPGQIVNRLVKTAKPPESVKNFQAPDPFYGYGTIRPYSALTEDIPPGPENGPLQLPTDSSLSSPSSAPPIDQPAAQAEKTAGEESDNSSSGLILGIGGGLVGLAAVAGGIVFAVTRKNRRSASSR